MAIALVNHLAQASTDGNGFTSAAIDTTGANLLIFIVSDGDGLSTVSDSKGNTWTKAVASVVAGAQGNTLWYAQNANAGTGHTFTVTDTADFPAIAILAFSGAGTSGELDQHNFNNPNGINTSVTTGSVTPSVNGEVVVTGIVIGNASVLSINSGFTITDQIGGAANNLGIGAAYLIQTTATAENPTWTGTIGTIMAADIATFNPPGGGAPPAFYPYGFPGWRT